MGKKKDPMAGGTATADPETARAKTDGRILGADVFVANRAFPDAPGVFFPGYLSLEQIKTSCIVVIDTNALLVPYGIGKQSLQQIAATYRLLANEKRLVIPGQV